MVYENCKFYGPYQSKKDKRLRCLLIYPNGKRITLSYPKYLIEVHLDRYLEKEQQAHESLAKLLEVKHEYDQL